MPPVNEVLIILQGANQTHGVSDKDIITNFDKYFDNGGDTLSLFNVVMELLEESGFFVKKQGWFSKTTIFSLIKLSLVTLLKDQHRF